MPLREPAPELSKTATEGHELAAIGPAGPSGMGAPGVSPISNGVALLTVVVKSYDERLSTDELLRKYAAELDHKLREVDSRRAVDELLQAKLRDRFEKLSANWSVRKDALHKIAVLHGVSEDPELNVQRRARNQAEVEAAGVELIGLEARRKVLEEQIAKLADQAKSDTGDDPVLNELRTGRQSKDEGLFAVCALMANGKVGEANVNEAELNLVAAKTELAKYRRAGQPGEQR